MSNSPGCASSSPPMSPPSACCCASRILLQSSPLFPQPNRNPAANAEKGVSSPSGWGLFSGAPLDDSVGAHTVRPAAIHCPPALVPRYTGQTSDTSHILLSHSGG